MNKLKYLMDKRGLTQKEVAEATGVTESNMSLYINAKRMPNAVTAYKIAKFLRVKYEELFTEEN